MYIYQNGKLYISKGNVLVGVEIYPDKGVFQIGGTDTIKLPCAITYSSEEILAKFNITKTNPYLFPRELKEEEKTIEPINIIKKPVGRPPKRV